MRCYLRRQCFGTMRPGGSCIRLEWQCRVLEEDAVGGCGRLKRAMGDLVIRASLHAHGVPDLSFFPSREIAAPMRILLKGMPALESGVINIFFIAALTIAVPPKIAFFVSPT